MSDFTLYIEKNPRNFYQDPILYQEVALSIKKFSNEELLYYKYFHENTKVFPESILLLNNFIFYFIDGAYYADVNDYLDKFRREIKHKKIIFIYMEDVLVNLIYRFFPNLFIYDLIIKNDNVIPEIIVTVLSYKERSIAIGRSGTYIKMINKIFEDYIDFKGDTVKLKCEVFYSFQ